MIRFAAALFFPLVLASRRAVPSDECSEFTRFSFSASDAHVAMAHTYSENDANCAGNATATQKLPLGTCDGTVGGTYIRFDQVPHQGSEYNVVWGTFPDVQCTKGLFIRRAFVGGFTDDYGDGTTLSYSCRTFPGNGTVLVTAVESGHSRQIVAGDCINGQQVTCVKAPSAGHFLLLRTGPDPKLVCGPPGGPAVRKAAVEAPITSMQ